MTILSGLAYGDTNTEQAFYPESINYVYPIKPKPQPEHIYDPNDFKNYNYLTFSVAGIHQHSQVAGFDKSSWFNFGGGVEFGHMWNYGETNNFYGISLGAEYLGSTSHTSYEQKGSFNSYSFALPLKLHYLRRFDNFSIDINGGGAYGIGLNTNSGAVKTNLIFNNVLAVAGAGVSYDWSKSVHLMLNYNHYFGGWTKPSYKSVGGFPSIDMVSVGVKYAF